MRVHLPALLALVSAATYVACGSSDNSKVDQEGGAGGEAGESTGAGGTQSTGASQNSGGTLNNPQAGEGGMLGVEAGAGGMAPVNSSGAGGEVSGGGAGGEGTGPSDPDDPSFPAACPGPITDYVAADGGSEPDTFDDDALSQTVPDGPYSQVFARGFAGDDVFEYDYEGSDCILGGAGDDDFSAPAEYGSVFVGGSGADVYHLASSGGNTPTVIVDMTSEDTLGLSKATFSFLNPQVGEMPDGGQVYSIADYEAGTGSIPSGEGSAIVYDPNTGGLWRDNDRGMKDVGAGQIVKILNYDQYAFSLDDFVIDP